jgi:hypothetical protein
VKSTVPLPSQSHANDVGAGAPFCGFTVAVSVALPPTMTVLGAADSVML